MALRILGEARLFFFCFVFWGARLFFFWFVVWARDLIAVRGSPLPAIPRDEAAAAVGAAESGDRATD